jgi:hypothetical protein
MFTFLEEYDVQETRRIARTKDASIVRLHNQGATPENISLELDVPLDDVCEFLRDSGLVE